MGLSQIVEWTRLNWEEIMLLIIIIIACLLIGMNNIAVLASMLGAIFISFAAVVLV